MNRLPVPGPHNEPLRALLRDRIRNEGPLRFSEFVRLVLYHPEHGYYLTNDPVLDYQSSPNVHPLFGACIARQVAGFWREMGCPTSFTVFEAAAGSGRLCADLLSALRSQEPDLYNILHYVQQDPSLLTANAESRLRDAGVPSDKVDIAAELPREPVIDGCIISNELLDALPFDRVRVRKGTLLELRTALDGEDFVDIEAEPSAELTAHFQTLGVLPGEGCDAEAILEAPRWVSAAANALRSGYLLTLDYGYDAADLYASWRKRGTLLTFYRHTSDDNPYARIGRQDITCSVDFTSIARAAEAEGLQTIAQATQAEYLSALGIGEALARPPDGNQIEAYYALRRAAIELTDLSGLGRIRVLIHNKVP